MTTSTSNPAASARRTVLVTDGSGDVDHALLERLRGQDVICLTHRTPITVPGVTSLHGDVCQPRLGLTLEANKDLTRRVDAVRHCAAVTELNRTDGSLEATNVTGTQRM